MSIRFYLDEDGTEIMSATKIVIPHGMPERIFVMDTCILLPTMLPRERRTLTNMEKVQKKLDRGKETTKFERDYNRKKFKRCIRVVNAIEDGIFYGKGFYIGVTRPVYNELIGLERRCEENNVKDWLESVKGKYACTINLPIKALREKYKPLSRELKHTGDFSVAMAAYLLGCRHASDDYNSMEYINKLDYLNDLSHERFGKRGDDFQSWDSECLVMLLDGTINAYFE